MTRTLRIGCVMLAMVGCKKGDEPKTAQAPKLIGKTKVAFLLSTLQEERYQKDKRYFEAKARSLDLAPFTFSADNDNSKQLAQVEDAIARGAKVIVVQPTDSSAAASYVQRAHSRGVAIIAYDRAIKSDGPAPDAYVSHDSFQVGVLQAQAAVKATGGKGNYVLLQGQSGHSVAMEIARGYMSVLKQYIDRGDIKVVLDRNHDAWGPDQALRSVEDAIAKTKGDIAAILANNSGMARGAVQAVTQAKLADKHIFIAGADADAANINWVCEGKQSVEVLKDIRPLAEKAAETARALDPKNDQKTAVDKNIAVPVVLVTKDDVKKLILDSGFQEAKELPSCSKITGSTN